jgi:anti-sigma-K factor RskA
MVMSMPSEELQLLIAGYVLGDLSAEEAAAFEQVLAQNPAIATDVAQMQAALEQAYAPAEVVPPAHLRSKILDQVQTASSAPVRSITAKPRRLRLRSALEIAAAALIVALGFNNYRLWQALQASQTTASQYAALTYVLRATADNNQASARVVVDPNNLEAAIAVENLPPLPPGKVYALWTVVQPNAPVTTDEKKAILTEVFQVDEQGNFSQTISVPKVYRSSDIVTKVAVTIEDANAPQQHTGTPILITGL